LRIQNARALELVATGRLQGGVTMQVGAADEPATR
jgi:hypothetical protein